MKMTLTKPIFRDEFRRAGRADQFSYDALGLLFDYFEDCDPDMEIDVIEICCEFAEDTIENIAEFYDFDVESVAEELANATSVVGTTTTGTIVYQQF